MRIKNGFMLREVADSYVVVAVGKRSSEFNGMVSLNETGAFLWKAMEKDIMKEELVQALLDTYEVSKEQAVDDVDKFIAMITENGFAKE
ncbi:MAG: PqqD family protein [Lachnospiraceae bacterium]|nr:PqqD family protein [Lachnospiraceae bacterium]